MTISCGTGTQILRNRPQAMGIDMARLAQFLRGRYPVGTAPAVASDLDVSPRTVEGWLSSCPSTPRANHIVRGILVYGPEFLSVLMPEPPGWLSKAARAQKREQLLSEIEDLERQLNT